MIFLSFGRFCDWSTTCVRECKNRRAVCVCWSMHATFSRSPAFLFILKSFASICIAGAYTQWTMCDFFCQILNLKRPPFIHSFLVHRNQTVSQIDDLISIQWNSSQSKSNNNQTTNSKKNKIFRYIRFPFHIHTSIRDKSHGSSSSPSMGCRKRNSILKSFSVYFTFLQF